MDLKVLEGFLSDMKRNLINMRKHFILLLLPSLIKANWLFLFSLLCLASNVKKVITPLPFRALNASIGNLLPAILTILL